MLNKTTLLAAGLSVSLLANFFLAGHMVGRFHGHPGMMPPNAAADRALQGKLSDADRKVMKEAMEKNRDRMEKLHRSLEESRKAVGAAVKADPFDPAALDAALTKEKNEKMAFLLTMREARAEMSQKLSPEGREALSKMNRFGPDGFGKGPRGMHGMGKGMDSDKRLPPPPAPDDGDDD